MSEEWKRTIGGHYHLEWRERASGEGGDDGGEREGKGGKRKEGEREREGGACVTLKTKGSSLGTEGGGWKMLLDFVAKHGDSGMVTSLGGSEGTPFA
jgi:hypothetical protein